MLKKQVAFSRNMCSILVNTSIRGYFLPQLTQIHVTLVCFLLSWTIYEWMGNSMRHKVQNKALDNFDWLSQWLE